MNKNILYISIVLLIFLISFIAGEIIYNNFQNSKKENIDSYINIELDAADFLNTENSCSVWSKGGATIISKSQCFDKLNNLISAVYDNEFHNYLLKIEDGLEKYYIDGEEVPRISGDRALTEEEVKKLYEGKLFFCNTIQTQEEVKE